MLRSLLSHGKPIHHLAADIMLETGLDAGSILLKLLDDPDPALVKVGLVAMWGQAVPEVIAGARQAGRRQGKGCARRSRQAVSQHESCAEG